MNISWPALFVICGTLIAIVLVLPIPRSRRKATEEPQVALFQDNLVACIVANCYGEGVLVLELLRLQALPEKFGRLMLGSSFYTT